MLKNRDTLNIIFFLALILLLWIGIKSLPAPAAEQLPCGLDAQNLTTADFDNTVFITVPRNWESWAEKLYTPEELRAAEPSVPHNSFDHTQIQYATHRTRLTLPTNERHAVRLYEYAMRLLIDGTEIGNAGKPEQQNLNRKEKNNEYKHKPNFA